MVSREQQFADYFNSLVRKQVKKKRTCLSRSAKNCRRSFLSESAGKRICPECRIKNDALGAMASQVV
jgi:ribosome-binding factor A